MSNFVKVILVFGIYLFSLGAQAVSLNFGQGSPAEFFKNNPDAAQRFFDERVANNDTLSAEQKIAYQAMLGLSDAMAGDAVNEIMDPTELAWYYGWQDQLEQEPQGLLHNAAKIVSTPEAEHYQDCLARAMCVMVSKGSQRVYAFVDGVQFLLNDAGRGQENFQPWARVSTARKGKTTPNGLFTVEELANAGRVSSLYEGAALYYAMQIYGNIFIHATSPGNYSALGSPASAGCIRTRFSVSEQLNLLMRQIGGRVSGVLQDASSIRVIVADSVPDEYLAVY